MANINEFKSRLRGGGARANQFKVTLPFPGYAAIGGETSDLAFLCTATAIPGQTVASVPVNFRGRILNLADYQVDFFVDQLDRNGDTLKSYTFRGGFPTALSDIALDYGTNNEVETFTVEFSYQFFETDTTT